MKAVLRASLPATALAWCAILATPAAAQVSPDFSNSKVVVVEQEAGDHRLLDQDFRHLPFVDQEQMAKVRQREWFQPIELQEK
jgi:hypothetical protein